MRWWLKVFLLGAVTASLTVSSAVARPSHSIFIYYPAFRAASPAVEAPTNATIDMVDDKGVVNDLLINCGGGRSGILTESKIEGLFCAPDHYCLSDIKAAIRRLCR